MEANSATAQSMTIAGLNLIQQALTIYDSDLKLVLANKRFHDMFKLPREFNVPGADFGETIKFLAIRGEYGDIEDIEAFVQGRVDQALAFEQHYLERLMSNGRWISVEGSPLPEGGWVAVYTDITSTKRQEQLLRTRSEELSDQLLQYAEELSATNRQLESTVNALEEAKRQLTDSEARMRLTAEMMPAHIAHVGPDSHYTYSNRRLTAVMPGRPSNIVGQHIRNALGESAYLAIEPHLEAAFHGKASVFEFNDHLSTRRIRVAFTPDGGVGLARGVYILSMDVTEETQTRVALQQTRRREIAAQMTSGLAHDFSNLLTIILGMQSKLQRMEMVPEASELVEATVAASRRGGTLLNRIADMTGHRAPEMQPVNMDVFLADLQTLANPTLPPDISLTIQNNIPDVPILADPGMLQDSLVNLILNARDACSGQGAITITTEMVHDTWLQLRVTDTGTGFSEEALKRALDPFFTTKGGDGSGLGLAMVYDVTKLAGGEVRLGNTDVGGSVTLRLPLRRAQTQQAPGLVLLVEDNPDLRGLIRDMLIDMEHTVIEAASVEEAHALLASVSEISMVLSDISLEGDATGVDLIKSLRTDGTPSFLMTSLPQTHPLYIEGAARAPVLSKPFDVEQLDAFLHTR
ncbi:PAS-domain containing protein [Shimia thalassica]|uniref:hybrid sensor histidine kinase/response regulator n=1 Tax=Shimia thalassica TaxID=1715693 RepID=UPI0027323216|nr:PAS-domain containing protein [Shimia thalassica]MDP2581073.1 PAS-domain containing protein [Shimia thalassica]